MATNSADDLRRIGAQLVKNEECWIALLQSITPAQRNWRERDGRWSVGEHLAHLNLVDASYLPHLDAMLAQARVTPRDTRRVVARSRFSHWIGALLVRGAEPPVRVRVRTALANVPPSNVDVESALLEFARLRQELLDRIDAAVALGCPPMRARYVQGIGPARFVTLTFTQWLALTAAHDQPHLWPAQRVRPPVNRGPPG